VWGAVVRVYCPDGPCPAAARAAIPPVLFTPKAGTLGRTMAMFEANQGQIDSQVKFLSHSSRYSVFINKYHELPKGMMYFSG
jgi:hypothetical protein